MKASTFTAIALVKSPNKWNVVFFVVFLRFLMKLARQTLLPPPSKLPLEPQALLFSSLHQEL